MPETREPRQRNRMKKLPRNIIALGIVSLFTDIATEMMYPLIPVLLPLLGSGALALGIIEGIAETTAALLKLVSGLISDRLRKRKFLVVAGYAISSLARPFTGAAVSAWQIAGVRALDRVGKGIRTAPRDSLIASSAEGSMRGQAFGFDRAMDHTGAVIGPLLAAGVFLLLIDSMAVPNLLPALRSTFYFSLLPGLAAVLVVAFAVRETADPIAPGTSFSLSLKNFDGNFLRYLLVVFLFTLGNSSDAFLLFRTEESIHTSGFLYRFFSGIPVAGELIARIPGEALRQQVTSILFLPLIWAYFHILKALFSTPIGSLSDRVGRKVVIISGWGIYAVVYCAFAFLDRLPGEWQVVATFILFGIYAFYYAFTEGVEKAFVADLVPAGRRGAAFGLYNFAIGIGALPASIIFGILYSHFGAFPAFGMGAVLAFASMIALLVFVKEAD
jgi:MFS family permease